MEATIESKVKGYARYKDSGVEWLGEIPEHWEVKPGFTILSESKKRNTGFIEKTVLSLSYGNVIIRPEEKLTGLVPESFETYQLVEPGDIIIRPTDLQNDKTSLRTGLAKNKGIITSAYINLRVKKRYSNVFHHYYIHTIDINKVVYGLGSGLRQNISFDDFKRFPFPIPPLPEQTAIANFLDNKTQKIDQAIGIKEQQITLLKERKQILIHKAVTQGLDPNVKLKDSGVEWIGEIPKHWEVKRLKYLGNIFAGITGKSGDDFSKDEKVGYKPFIPFTSIFKDIIIDVSKHQFVNIREAENQNKIKRGDILFLMSSETLEDIGRASIYLGQEVELYLNSFCKGFRIKKNNIDAEFLNHSLQSTSYRNYFSLKGRGFTRINIKQEYILDLLIPFPSILEQKEISKYIESASLKIETAIGIKRQEIEKLKEYKGSLINGCVTGKVRVN